MTINFKLIPITENEVECRLDRVIRKNFPYLNQALIEKALRNKSILVNKKKEKSNYRLKQGEALEIADFLIKDLPVVKKKITSTEIKLITDNIIYQDVDLIAINKPAGLAVQGGSKIKTSVDDIMPAMLETLETWDKITHKLVHRLDKETSGVLLIALNDKTARELALTFKEHRLTKKYLAILSGKITQNSGQISSDVNQENAITNFKVLARRSNASLVEFEPITGKTHQLRLHSIDLGFPILGDSKYNPAAKKTDKLHLHAYEITVPFKSAKLRLKAELPDYFAQSIKEIFGKNYAAFLKNK